MARLLRYISIIALLIGAYLMSPLVYHDGSTIAFAESKGVKVSQVETEAGDSEEMVDFKSLSSSDEYSVQAVLSAKKSAVISGAMDGVLEKLPFENGDSFKKGDILVQYNCRFERAKNRESKAQLAVSSRKAKAYANLKESNAVADVEYVSILQEYERAKAIVEQTRSRLELCVIKAPFNGRVTDKIANTHEAVKSGRVLMEISSNEPLQAELLVPSVWLRWLNIGTGLEIAVHETGRSYSAKIKRIHGKVDPVTQTAYVVAQVSRYEEELLPGMSGRAIFGNSDKATSNGFLGMKIEGYGEGN